MEKKSKKEKKKIKSRIKLILLVMTGVGTLLTGIANLIQALK